MRLVLGIMLVCLSTAAGADAAMPAVTVKGPAQRYAELDAHALAAPASAEASFTSLVAYLTKPATTDTEKARVIYAWMADRIRYDMDTYLGKKPSPEFTAEAVLTARTSVCEGYASLFQRLASLAGLDVVSIPGFAKGYGRLTGNEATPNHAWNAVRINGQWRLIDSTWGAGYVVDGQFKKAFNEFYFLATPEQLLFTHFPEDPVWQLQSTGRITREQFHALPELGTAYFALGIKGEALWQALQESRDKLPLAQPYATVWNTVLVQSAPLLKGLKLNQEYEFRISSSVFEKMAIVQNQQWHVMAKENDAFVLRFTPQSSGMVLVAGKHPGVTEYAGILSYEPE